MASTIFNTSSSMHLSAMSPEQAALTPLAERVSDASVDTGSGDSAGEVPTDGLEDGLACGGDSTGTAVCGAAGLGAGVDTGLGAGVNAGVDAGLGAGVEAGVDAGLVGT